MLSTYEVRCQQFWREECGAVTVDWVVLTAAVVGLAVVVLMPVANGTESMTAKTSGYIDDVEAGAFD